MELKKSKRESFFNGSSEEFPTQTRLETDPMIMQGDRFEIQRARVPLTADQT
jgi:hypothetical protein